MDDSLRSGTPCSMIICDIDRFKHVNDIYGRQAGDEALTSFATLLRQHARAGIGGPLWRGRVRDLVSRL